MKDNVVYQAGLVKQFWPKWITVLDPCDIATFVVEGDGQFQKCSVYGAYLRLSYYSWPVA